MDKQTNWMSLRPLAIGLLALLVFGLAPMASAGNAEDRAARIAAREALKAERQAAREALKAARQAEKEARIAARAERIAARQAEKAARIAAREAEKAAQEQESADPEPAAKPVASELMRGTASGWIGPEGGVLKIFYKGGPGGKDNVLVQFIVPENALAAPEEISMSLELDTRDLSSLTVVFAPSGLDFLIPAKLKLKLGKDVAKGLGYESMVGLHYSGDPETNGELIEVVPLVINPGGRAAEVLLEVPGFSRYSLGGA